LLEFLLTFLDAAVQSEFSAKRHGCSGSVIIFSLSPLVIRELREKLRGKRTHHFYDASD